MIFIQKTFYLTNLFSNNQHLYIFEYGGDRYQLLPRV